MEEFVEGFMSDDPEGLTPIDVVIDVTGLTYDEVKSSCKIVTLPALSRTRFTLLDMDWIKVEDALPNDMDVVVVWSNTTLHPTIAFYFRNDWMYYAINQGCYWISSQPHTKITHWMPLPEPPLSESNTQNKG